MYVFVCVSLMYMRIAIIGQEVKLPQLAQVLNHGNSIDGCVARRRLQLCSHKVWENGVMKNELDEKSWVR